MLSDYGGTWWNINAAGATAAYWCSSRAHLEHPPSPGGGEASTILGPRGVEETSRDAGQWAEWAILAAAPTSLAVGSSREPEHTR